MIVVYEAYGQLCNRLFLSAYGMALAQATGQCFLNLSLGEYRPLFPSTRLPRTLNRLHRLARRHMVDLQRFPAVKRQFVTVNFRNAPEFSPHNSSFIATVKRRRLTVIEGWPDLSKIRFSGAECERIRARFKPDTHIGRQAKDAADRARTGADLLVGVHMRLGDYAKYLKGIFLYPPEVYRSAMQRMTEFFPESRVAFLLCSNEPQRAETFAPFQVTAGPGTQLGDLFTLSECDYVLGPPSTFSLWAAFYASKPIYHLIDPKPPKDLSAFMIPDGHFECIDLRLDSPEIKRRLEEKASPR